MKMPQIRVRYVVMVNGYTVGPFANFEEANAYRESDDERDDMELFEFVPPARNWKRRLK